MNGQLQPLGLFIVADNMVGFHWFDLILPGLALMIVAILVFGLRALRRRSRR